MSGPLLVIPMIGMPEGAEWLIILAVVVLLFGAKKLPDLARSTGRSLRIFKAETKGLMDEDDDDTTPAIESRASESGAHPDHHGTSAPERHDDAVPQSHSGE